MLVGEIMHSGREDGESSSDSFADVAKRCARTASPRSWCWTAQKLAGIVTERDIVNLVAEGGDPNTTTVEHGMTRRDLITVDSKTELSEAAEQMVSKQHPAPADRRRRQRRGDRVDPRHDPMGGRGALRRSRDAGHRELARGAPGGEPAPAQARRLNRRSDGLSPDARSNGSRGSAERSELREVPREEQRHRPVHRDLHAPRPRRHREQVVRAMQEPPEEPLAPQPLDDRDALVAAERTDPADVRVDERLERSAGEGRLDVRGDTLPLTEAVLRGRRGQCPRWSRRERTAASPAPQAPRRLRPGG